MEHVRNKGKMEKFLSPPSPPPKLKRTKLKAL
jgi:hypothetical protein